MTKKNYHISTYVNEETFKEIEALAIQEERTIADITRRLINKALKGAKDD